jgi:2-isopropylmalate synthase
LSETLPHAELIHDWNTVDHAAAARPPVAPEIEDVTLRETRAPLAAARALLPLMASLGMTAANIGWADMPHLPELCKWIHDQKLPLEIGWSTPATRDGVQQAAQIMQQSGMIGHLALHHGGAGGDELAAALRTAHGEHLPVTLVIEEVARLQPSVLGGLVIQAVAARVPAICLYDTAGLCSPHGAARLVAFARRLIAAEGASVRVDWCGRNDRDLGVMNALAAHEAGALRLGAAALGFGPGAGCASLDLLLVNLRLNNILERDLTVLEQYCQTAARELGQSIPVNYPVFGADAFRTATGVHASAIIKAQNKGDVWLADRVYSGVPAGWFGRSQVIDVGPMSGESNVVAWLRAHGHESTPELIKRIIARAKQSAHTLSAQEIQEEIGTKS